MVTLVYGSKTFVVVNDEAASMMKRAIDARESGDIDKGAQLFSQAVKLEVGATTPEVVEVVGLACAA